MSREYTYTINEILDFIGKYFDYNLFERRGDGLLTEEYSLYPGDIDAKFQYFKNDLKVFNINLSTFSGGWEYKRHYLLIEMGVLEKENRFKSILHKPGDIYVEKTDANIISKEEIFDEILNFLKITSDEKQLRNINLIELGI